MKNREVGTSGMLAQLKKLTFVRLVREYRSDKVRKKLANLSVISRASKVT